MAGELPHKLFKLEGNLLYDLESEEDNEFLAAVDLDAVKKKGETLAYQLVFPQIGVGWY